MAVEFTDNGDGTWTATGLTDNGDGTWSTADPSVTVSGGVWTWKTSDGGTGRDLTLTMTVADPRLTVTMARPHMSMRTEPRRLAIAK